MDMQLSTRSFRSQVRMVHAFALAVVLLHHFAASPKKTADGSANASKGQTSSLSTNVTNG